MNLFPSAHNRRLIPANCHICLNWCHDLSGICSECEKLLPWLGSSCTRCGLPYPENQLRSGKCGKCLGREFPIDSCRTLFTYDTPVRQLVNMYKHGQRFDIGKSFSTLMVERLDQGFSELLLPVPIGYRRFCGRGFNQSWELTRQISSALDIPCSNKVLKKCRHTPPQSSQPSSRQRRRSMANAFDLADARELQNVKQVTIIDDVITTMSTVNSLARLLKSHGIRRVHAWGIARTC